jgi:hypothetical protein
LGGIHSSTGGLTKENTKDMKKYKVGGRAKAAVGDIVTEEDVTKYSYSPLNTVGNKGTYGLTNPNYTRTLSVNNSLDNPVSIPRTSTTAPSNTRNDLRLGLTGGDLIGAGANVIGSILSSVINSRALGQMKPPPKPIARPRMKLKTKININPQLDKTRETLAAYERGIHNNTSSSAVALARLNRLRNLATQEYNTLYGNKENLETQLINQDSINAQNVAEKNIVDGNQWATNVTDFRNKIIDARSENAQSLVSGLTGSVQDLISRGERRRNYDRNLVAIAAANPNVTSELLRTLGFDKTMIRRK